jgi:hypothetical protein
MDTSLPSARGFAGHKSANECKTVPSVVIRRFQSQPALVGELSNTLSTGDVGPVGAIGNVISIPTRATMAYEKPEINELQQL